MYEFLFSPLGGWILFIIGLLGTIFLGKLFLQISEGNPIDENDPNDMAGASVCIAFACSIMITMIGGFIVFN